MRYHSDTLVQPEVAFCSWLDVVVEGFDGGMCVPDVRDAAGSVPVVSVHLTVCR
jgi:hypothetical protein